MTTPQQNQQQKKAPNFDDLLMASSAFTTMVEDESSGDATATWKHANLSELRAASATVGGSGTYSETQDAQKLLGPNVNLNKLLGQKQQLKAAAVAEEQPPTLHQGIDAMLQRGEEEIVNRIIRQERESLERDLETRLLQRLDQDWKETRERWLHEIVGYRHLGGSSSSSSAAPLPGAPALPGGGGGMPRTRTVTPPPLQTIMPVSGALIDVAFQHVALITGKKPSQLSAHQLLEECQRLAEDDNNAVNLMKGASAYSNACQLLRAMTMASSSSSTPREAAATGALSHLCRQYHRHVESTLRQATLTGRAPRQQHQLFDNLSGVARDVATYVEMELGQDRATLWPTFYYCLRLGDAAAANEIVTSATRHGLVDDVEHSVLQAINLLARFQSSHNLSCVWDASAADVRSCIPEELRHAVSDLYQRATAHGGGDGDEENDAYWVASLGLLSASSPPTSSPAIRTIEDYLLSFLWHAVQQPSRSSTEALIHQLGQMLKHWGPAYFDPHNEEAGWSFCFPLMVAQQFRTALTHLGDQGPSGLLQAAHLALALHLDGHKIRDLGDDHDDDGDGKKDAGVLRALLASYAFSLQSVDPAAALQYLVLIPDQEGVTSSSIGREARKQIRRLVLETKQFELLAGTLVDDGQSFSRKGGALEALFSSEEISSILADAAGDAVNKGNIRDAAELLVFSRRYGALLSLLNRQLAVLLVPTEENYGERNFWQLAAHQFREVHYEKGGVLQVLDAEGSRAPASTFDLLLSLMKFVDLSNARNYEEAWELIDRLQLLPASDAQLSLKAADFRSLDPVVQQCFPHFLVGAMESLYEQHSELKSRTGTRQTVMAADAVNQRIKEVRQRARYLAAFAGMLPLGNAGDAKAKISRMETFMV